MTKRGRPPLPEGEARTVVLRVRLNARELSVVRAQAARRGLSLTEYVRRAGKPDQYPASYFQMRPD